MQDRSIALGDAGREVGSGWMMARYRDGLPQLSGSTVFLSDGGMETDLIFHEGFDLPLFASFPLLETREGFEALGRYYRRFAQVADDAGCGFVLEAVTWRASRNWATPLGYSTESLAEANRRAVAMLVDLRDELGEHAGPVVISAPIGPRGDAYHPDQLMTPRQSREYHSEQIETLVDTEADLLTAFTLTHAAEAIGIVQAAHAVELPVAVSFTVETDGALPDGMSLAAAIRAVDDATGTGPVYYGINCAHPTHFVAELATNKEQTARIRMVRANASQMSHADLDDSTELDDGDPEDLALRYFQILDSYPHINVLGGCCGTDVRHVQAIARACL
jgi:S-methylmethionine-dependent homocysteine/selenocysteine methylase